MPNPLAGLWPHKALARAKALLTQSEHLAQRDGRIEEHEAAIEHAKEALLTKYFDKLLWQLQAAIVYPGGEEIGKVVHALTSLCRTLRGTIASTQMIDVNSLLVNARNERRKLDALLETVPTQAGAPASKSAVDGALDAHVHILCELRDTLGAQLRALRDIQDVVSGGTHARFSDEAMKALHNVNAHLAGLLARERGQLETLLRSKDAEALTAKIRDWLDAFEREVKKHQKAHPTPEEGFVKNEERFSKAA